MTLSEDRDALRADRSLRGLEFSAAWRTLVDAWLVERFADATEGTEASGIALVAVGGYGRGDLAPASDLDLLLLHHPKVAPGPVAEKIWYPIWDEGLKLGHSVRTIADALDLASSDLDTATSLLTMRHLAGDQALTDELAASAAAQWRKKAKRSLSQLRASVSSRQDQFGEVAFLLEPDLKEGRGGLRDIHSLRWAERARSVLEEGDDAALTEAEAVLFTARVELHRLSGKPVERLAAYLLAAASIGDNEGGGTMVWDALPSGYVAHVLGVSIDGLARGLADLEQMGLIEGAGGGIRIPNALALAVFSEPQLTSV